MAKKRRGRPPGSKNTSSIAKLGSSVASMDVGQLRDYIGSLESALAKKIQQQKDALEGQLAELQGYVSSKAAGVVRTVMRVPRTGKRAKAKPKYQSKKNKSLKWSGRGVTPVWMREEKCPACAWCVGFVFSSASSHSFSDQLLWYRTCRRRLAAKGTSPFWVRAPNFALMPRRGNGCRQM